MPGIYGRKCRTAQGKGKMTRERPYEISKVKFYDDFSNTFRK